MNFSTITGIIAAGFVVWFGVIAPSARPQIFMDPHALILVLGGTFAAALIAFPFKQFRELISFFFMAAILPPKKQFGKTVEHLLELYVTPNPSAINGANNMHPYLLEAFLLSKREHMSNEELKMILQSRHLRFKERYAWDAKVLSALAKFPPAFGLLGATTGMISMMTNLGVSGKDAIGPSMAVALVATFWGIGLANFVLLPLADHALKLNSEDARLRHMISTGLVLIHQRVPPTILLEHCLGYLPPHERSNPRFGQLLFKAKNDPSQQLTSRAS